jgi:cytochrome c oxidase assembly protein subunit 15
MHLGLALAIYAAMLWVALGLAAPDGPGAAPGLRRHAGALAALVYAMVLTGALVAGIHAGLAYNTWPLMDGHWVPPEILLIDPWWKNFVYNMATVQFDHRMLAIVIAAVAWSLWWRVSRDASADARAKAWGHALALAVALQLAAGISTLLLRVPLALAALHQAGAVIVFTCAIGLLRSLMPARPLQA